MVAAVVRKYFLNLLVISNFVIYGHKGIAHAQNCLKSAETVVPKCPENQREWEEAAQRKKCSEIQKHVNCTDVEYHCLVNEFRNETVEVCTKPKFLQGYCPIYSSLNAVGNEYMKAVRNDYKKKCDEYSYPCNCSTGYRSKEAYKWQCCYIGTNKLNSGENQNVTDLNEKSYPSLRCCPDSIWDDEQNKCVGCPAGYLGPNCTIPCNPPQYGKECRFTCTCKGYETCHPSNGCVSPPPTTTTTEITTTIKGCPAGYLGPNCTIPCNPPQYGKECQFTCICKGFETCHPSNGCVSPPPPTTTTEITTTIKGTMLILI